LLNSRFPTIVKALERFEPGIIFDGEIVALDDNGRPAFNLLQNFRFTAKQIHFYAFDLLAERNKNLMGLALEKRRELLAIRLEDVADPIRFSESIDGSPQSCHSRVLSPKGKTRSINRESEAGLGSSTR
jgi:bifunctional non-homologous end joining protein LigD